MDKVFWQECLSCWETNAEYWRKALINPLRVPGNWFKHYLPVAVLAVVLTLSSGSMWWLLLGVFVPTGDIVFWHTNKARRQVSLDRCEKRISEASLKLLEKSC